jgi:ABC-type Fe3+-siderophore transport system permease subunit
MRIPPRLIALDATGALLAGVGLAGLLTDLSDLLPFLANPDIAGAMAGAGFALMAFAVFKIVQHLRTQRRRP